MASGPEFIEIDLQICEAPCHAAQKANHAVSLMPVVMAPGSGPGELSGRLLAAQLGLRSEKAFM